MDRVALWVLAHALLALGWWAARALARDHAFADDLPPALACAAVLGAITAWVTRADGCRPPLPAPALAAVSSAHRALVRACVRGLVAGAGLLLLESADALWRGMSVRGSPSLWVAFAVQGLLAGAAVAAAAALEHVLLVSGRSPRESLGLAALLTPLVAIASVFVVFAQLGWAQGGWEQLRLPSADEWPIVLGLFGGAGLPIGATLAVLTACRLRGLAPGPTALTLAGAAPVVVPLAAAAWPRMLFGLELVAVLLVLPLAVRVGDLIGPGWPRDDAPLQSA